jgi:hypothetical protein
MVLPQLPGWGDPIGLAFFFAGFGVFLWGFQQFIGSVTKK